MIYLAATNENRSTMWSRAAVVLSFSDMREIITGKTSWRVVFACAVTMVLGFLLVGIGVYPNSFSGRILFFDPLTIGLVSFLGVLAVLLAPRSLHSLNMLFVSLTPRTAIFVPAH